ncbi:MAG: hypothetical protein P4M11_15300 [Candidatus Pacebacteria bacterium]|nr:hypothetical protein [Candidatus Paceibacterota bacterium]
MYRGTGDNKERIWLSVNAVLLLICTATRMFHTRKSKFKFLVMVTIGTRALILIPQLLVSTWCLMYRYFYATSTGSNHILHSWMKAVVIYGHVFAFLTAVDLLVVAGAFVFLVATSVGPAQPPPFSDVEIPV